MIKLSVYLPQDRLRALAQNAALPDRASGCALFADISGFTPLTEKLRLALGARLGAETLTRHLSRVYEALLFRISTHQHLQDSIALALH